MKSKKLLFLITTLVLLISILISNFISKTNTDTRSQAASVSPKISFPKDHLFHSNFKREWWYLNLMIRSYSDKDKTNKDTGYLISFSKIDGVNGLLTSRFDQSNNKFSQKTNYPGRINTNLDKGLLTVSFSKSNGPSMVLKELSPLKNGAKQYSLKGNSSEIGAVDLVLIEKTVSSKGYNTPLLWGCTGNISVFSPNDTFYYSIPDLDITGLIKDTDGTSQKVVVGKAWMDHQWFNSSPSSDWQGHYWSDLYLTTRKDFEGPHIAIGAVTQIYKSGPKYSYWVKRNTDGSNDCGTNLNFQINSKFSNGYPFKIKLNIDNVYSGEITPFSSSQIFNALDETFFEPMSYTMGKNEKTNYTGLGFFETGIKK
jgi:hypothetical protein